MSFKEKGKIISILPETTGTSTKGEWKKRTFVIETSEQYPKKIAFDLFNKTLNFGLNAEVEVSFSVESREYNEKWYSNINAFAVELIGVAPIQEPAKPANEPAPSSNMDDPNNDLPF